MCVGELFSAIHVSMLARDHPPRNIYAMQPPCCPMQ
jgi:hypothetical protein